VQARITK